MQHFPNDETAPKRSSDADARALAEARVRQSEELAGRCPRFSRERRQHVLQVADMLAQPPLSRDGHDVIEYVLAQGVPELGEFVWSRGDIPATPAQRERGLKRFDLYGNQGRILAVLAHKRTPLRLTGLFCRLLTVVSLIERHAFDAALYDLLRTGDVVVVPGRGGLRIALGTRRARQEGKAYRALHPTPTWTKSTDFHYGEGHARNVRDSMVVEWIASLGALPLSQTVFDFFDEGWHSFSGDLMKWFLNGLVAEGKATLRLGSRGLEVAI